MATNSDIESEIARSLSRLLGSRYEVHLHRGNRKKRRDAEFQANWDPEADSVRIAFSPMEEEVEAAAERIEDRAPKSGAADNRILDFMRALDRAEKRPGYDFVSLKWFRDTALACEDFSWATDPAARHEVLREAIDRRLVLTRKIANPRPPNYPVTTIHLNRLMPEVNAALGAQSSGPPAFRPVRIRGESLSATILHDRR